MTDNEFLLMDRIQKIQAINRQHDLLNNAHISFSGGKDSTVLHYLIDMALPNNKIPRMYINTGIEYNSIVKFVKDMAKNDDRIIVYNSGVKIHQMLEKYGYPFKSKEHAAYISLYQKHYKLTSYLENVYLNRRNTHGIIKCPYILEYQFTPEFKLKISKECCRKLKKETAYRFGKEYGKTTAITGMTRDEGGLRAIIKDCVITDKDGKMTKFHPLLVVTKEWEDWFIKEYNIKLCELYYPPYNFKRTGCKGCPFNLNLQQDLDTMERLLPAERKQCEIIWKPVYDEYRRIGYRLTNYEQLQFDI